MEQLNYRISPMHVQGQYSPKKMHAVPPWYPGFSLYAKKKGPEGVVLTFGYVYRSSFGSPGASAVNCFQTLQDKENNYYYLRYQEMNKKLPIWCDNDRLNLLAEHFSHVRIGFGIFPSRV